MDIPTELLQDLKCSRCNVYLSRSPVYLLHNGAALCNCCHKPQRPAIRNKNYETVAQLLRFPCKNRDLGCFATVPFAESTEEVPHEEVCKFRQYVCPLLGSARCDWIGTRNHMLEHCQVEHPGLVVDNPCRFTHDIAKSRLQNYLITAFNLLFLLHIKICVTTGKIFHAVRFLGASDEANTFKYTLNIKRNNEMLVKEGRVAPQGCLAIQEDTSLALNTNSLLDVLGGWDNTQFTLTLNNPNNPLALDNTESTCTKCTAKALLVYRSKDGWLCRKCSPAKRACANRAQGCRHQDIDEKCKKHELNFCEHKSICKICDAPIYGQDCLSAHYEIRHPDIISNAGATWRASPEKSKWRQRLLESVAGTVMCWYSINSNSVFSFYLYMPVTMEQLRSYKCTVQFTQPTTGETRTYTPEVSYNASYDWLIKLKKSEFPTWYREIDICVNILKTDS